MRIFLFVSDDDGIRFEMERLFDQQLIIALRSEHLDAKGRGIGIDDLERLPSDGAGRAEQGNAFFWRGV